MELLNAWSPLTATYEDLADFFAPCTVKKMESLLQIAVDMEEYEYAAKVSRILKEKKSTQNTTPPNQHP